MIFILRGLTKKDTDLCFWLFKIWLWIVKIPFKLFDPSESKFMIGGTSPPIHDFWTIWKRIYSVIQTSTTTLQHTFVDVRKYFDKICFTKEKSQKRKLHCKLPFDSRLRKSDPLFQLHCKIKRENHTVKLAYVNPAFLINLILF